MELLYGLASPDFYERPDLMVADATWSAIVRAQTPTSWLIGRHDIWLSCSCPEQVLPPHGFKIHVSTIAENADEVLTRVVRVCVEWGASFKLAATRQFLRLMDSKTYPLGGSGKFITVYPSDVEHFLTIITRLHQATADTGFVGPYILSDRRFNGSRLLFYRYGTLRAPQGGRLVLDGTRRAPPLEGPLGETIDDERPAFFRLPAWVSDPFGGSHSVSEPKKPILAGRFRVLSMLASSNRGNVYAAEDLDDGAAVVLKEARPHVSRLVVRGGTLEYADMLASEQRVLKRLARTGLTPTPIALFREWEHTFSAISFLPGVSLGAFSGLLENVLLPYIKWPGVLDRVAPTYCWIAAALIKAVQVVHEAGVVIGDLSGSNVLVDQQARAVYLLDFESSVILGDPAVSMSAAVGWSTPGHNRPGRQAAPTLTTAHDWYAVGMILLNWICFLSTLPEFAPSVVPKVLDGLRQIGVPRQMLAPIRCLLDDSDPVSALRELAMTAEPPDRCAPRGMDGSGLRA